jgi:beta-galactosidase
MRKYLVVIAVASALLRSCRSYHDYSNTEWKDKDLPEWEDLTVNTINTVAPHASMVSHPDNSSAMKAEVARVCQCAVPRREVEVQIFSQARRNGRTGSFKRILTPRQWGEIEVPSTWEREGYGVAYYVNSGYTFPVNPPFINHSDNPVGSYKRSFTIPSGWKGKEVFLNFDGVSSAFNVWINGEQVGYSEDSKTTAEFNITPSSRRVRTRLLWRSTVTLTAVTSSARISSGSAAYSGQSGFMPGRRRISVITLPTTLVNDYTDGLSG